VDGVTPPEALAPERSLDVRAEFPILGKRVYGKRLVYLDSAASSQKPRAVIEAVRTFYEGKNSNVHRGVHWLSQAATEAYEGARGAVRRFLNAAEDREIIFLRGTTEAINLVAGSFGAANLRAGDEVLVTAMEHHSNIVPWQLLCERTGARLRVAPIDDAGDVEWEAFLGLLGPRTKLVSVVHVSNSLGTVNPVRAMIEAAHAEGAKVLLDAAQSVPHLPIDVRALDCDFLAFSGHKVYGPTGIGALYAKAELLEAMPPWQGGGDMIRSVTFEKTEFAAPPARFEAGTPHIAGAVGLAAALEWLETLGRARVKAHEDALLAYAVEALRSVPGLRFVGTARERAGVVSFVIEGLHPHDVGTVVDRRGVAIRTGHHCTQPVMERFGVPATSRASFAVYNVREDVDALVAALLEARELLA
jgi:cysteine desulfurase/selenocysteine lyase